MAAGGSAPGGLHPLRKPTMKSVGICAFASPSVYVAFARKRTTDAQELANYRSKGPHTLNDRPATSVAFYGELSVLDGGLRARPRISPWRADRGASRCRLPDIKLEGGWPTRQANRR